MAYCWIEKTLFVLRVAKLALFQELIMETLKEICKDQTN